MELNTKSYSVALASAVLILCLILVSSIASAVTEQTASLTINETPITTSGSACCPSIYGDRIVWEDWRNGNQSDGPSNIYMYNISTQKETQITTSGSATSPSIYGNRIIWLDGRNGNSQNDTEGGHDVYMYDLSTHKETRITNSTIPEDGFAYELRIAISGNRILYGGTYNYCIYDISTQKKTYLIDVPIINPAFFGNIIVGVSDIDGRPSSLTMYDLSTNKETLITNRDSAFSPDIDNNIIVWADWRMGDDGDYHSKIYMYDLSTKKETQIANNGSIFYYSPAIFKDRIVWLGDQFYMYNLSTQEETHTNSTSISLGFDLYGDKIVWTDWGNENEKPNVYMGTLTSSNLPTAAFSASPTSGKAPMKVQFTDTSTGTPTSWFWNFGDGSKSFLQNPTHKYSKAGVYTVSLTVKDAAGRNTVTKTDYITVAAKPVAAFSASPTSGKYPLKVKFTDKSTGTPTKWIWNFGDGSKSFHQNPVHKYSKAGTYTISLTVKNAAGRNSVTKTKYVTVTSKPVAAFSASPTSGKYPLNVKFTDKSTGTPTKWKWDFGDGTKSFHQNPTHKYSKAGKYTVTLKVTNAAGINTATKSKYITVTGTSQAPTADFWGWPLSGKAPLKVKFTETSKGSPTSWKWDFGDGKSSTEKSPTHTYSAAGTYTVKLIATNEAGSSTKSKWKYIKVAK
ncbi:Chitin binding protein [Methanosarcina barkeri str. Wiesmoor]|uniref:Chitin binding protein n=2 Tax=Methanosarcina barkeri TaxID=2208 RepID=A0A0E3QPR5_METBA|nr:PKD domain-containing protein [Methanosarcina barkeri]AKB52507.1 Chitin binding protein [Methanosarcina barkeri str. Wiesmoor]